MISEGQPPDPRELVIDHRWVVRKIVNKLCALGYEKEREELMATGELALSEWAAVHHAGPGFARGAWLRVEGAARDYLRRRRRDRQRFVNGSDLAGEEFVSTAEGHDPERESAEQALVALEEEACGLFAARLLGAVGELQRMTPEDIAIARQDMQRTIALLDETIPLLPERDRQILHLHYYEQVPLREVGERMSPAISYPSVTRHHRDARVRLGKLLIRRGLTRAPRT